jgi:hypothetical protein
MSDDVPEHGLNNLNKTINDRGYFERVLTERDKTDAEREKRLNERFEGQERANKVAEQEREKSARALRDELENRIAEGDRNLRDHIANQVAQIKAALASAERLETERLEGMRQEIAAVRREGMATSVAAQKAIDKAEEAIQRRLDLLNEFRAQIADEATKYAQREVVDAQIKSLDARVTDLTDKVGKLV